jgi:hypothetical protein
MFFYVAIDMTVYLTDYQKSKLDILKMGLYP